ncbi:MAG: 4Fe-4S dicluster domain-containing protein [bacterium]
MTKEILVAYDKCMGCRSCETACAVAHSEAGNVIVAVLHGEKPLKRIFTHQVMDKKIPLNCRNCEDAPCLDACITGAMHWTSDGLVTNEGGEQECTGCWMYVMVCPYGVIRSLPDKRKAIKCDRMCFGDTEEPACVRACPTGALTYASVDQYGSKKRTAFLVKALSEE